MSERGAREKFRLLDISSDEESSDLHLEIIPKKKKVTRRDRNRGGAAKTPEPTFVSDLHCAIKWGLRGALVIWLVSLTWLSVTLYDQITTMKDQVASVSTSSNGVSDALQVCHTAAKELRANATELNTRLTELEKRHEELSALVRQAGLELAAVSTTINSAPSIADTPKRLEELKTTVSNLGSQITNCYSALETSSKQTLAAAKNSVAELEVRTNETIANLTANSRRIDALEHSLDSVNGTVMDKFQSLQIRIDNFTTLTTPAATQSTTTSTTSTTTSSTAAATVVAPFSSTTMAPPLPPSARQPVVPRETHGKPGVLKSN